MATPGIPQDNGIYIPTDDFNQQEGAIWAQSARRQTADAWAQQATAAAPAIAADHQDRADQAAAQQRQQTADDWAKQATVHAAMQAAPPAAPTSSDSLTNPPLQPIAPSPDPPPSASQGP